MATCAIAEFRDGTRVGLFAVFESDFLTVLESNRGSSKQLKKERAEHLRLGVVPRRI
jgi:hypothetical protein